MGDEVIEDQYFRDIRTSAVVLYYGEAAGSEPPHDGLVLVVDHGGDVWAVPDPVFGEFFEHCAPPAWAQRHVVIAGDDAAGSKDLSRATSAEGK